MDFLNIMGKIQTLQSEMQKAREDLSNITLESEAGGGMVKVKVNALRKILKITVDPEISNDKEMMGDLIAAAVNKALEEADNIARTEMAKITSGIIPGLDLSKFGL